MRKELGSLLHPEHPIVDRVCLAACVVAQTCGNVATEELRECAAKLFDVPPECELSGAFVLAYETERDAITQRRRTEKLQADLAGPTDLFTNLTE